MRRTLDFDSCGWTLAWQSDHECGNGNGRFGFGQQQLLVGLYGNAEVLIERLAAEFQFQQGYTKLY
jgi:hypothetical protein